jgi:mannan endo-1,4-beta-mannosidase
MRPLRRVQVLALLACGCGQVAEPAPDGGEADAGQLDAGQADAGQPDGGSPGGEVDAGAMRIFRDGGILLGAFLNKATTDAATVAAQLGRPLAYEMNYTDWSQPMLTSHQGWVSDVLARGALPQLSWQFDQTNFPTCDGVRFDDVLDGGQDAVILKAAQDLKSVPSVVMLRLWWEMNGGWYCQNERHQATPGSCDGTAKFRAAWRRVHDVFADAGASNVVWIWAPSHQDVTQGACANHWSDYYPGDAYVDVVGADGYNKFRDGGTIDASQPWTSFADLFTPIYEAYPGKPFMIAETNTAEDPADAGAKPAWVNDARAYLKQFMPRTVGFTWFVKGPVNGDPDDYRLDTSPQSLDAIRAMAQDPVFR